MTEQRVYRIPSFKWPHTVKRFERLNRKAAKLGVAPVSWEVLGEETVLVEYKTLMTGETATFEHPLDWEGEAHAQRTYTLVTVQGEAPKLAGWTFRGTLVHIPEVGNLMKTLGEVEVPKRYREADPWCEQCQMKRHRKDTFLVEKDGEWKQVGRQCLADFLGHTSPGAIASWAEVLANLEDDLADDEMESWGSGMHETKVVSTLGFLEVVAAVIEKYGWMSKAKAMGVDEPTADRALAIYTAPSIPTDRQGIPTLTITEEHKGQADEALTWARDLPEEAYESNDFLWNLHTVTASDYTPIKGVGILAAVFVAKAYREKEAIENERPAELDEWFGEVKKRETFELTVTFTTVIDGYYGSKQLVKFLDAESRPAVWFNTSADWEWDAGETYEVVATVKAHDTYEERKQTVLTRLKKKET